METNVRHSIRIELPTHLRALAKIEGHEVRVDVAGPVTVRAVLDALEAMVPALLGTIRDHGTGERRAYMRLFACQQDISHDSMDAALPRAVVEGKEPVIVLGAVAGG
jgi:molybdopterin synthase sulfur carrier subunit